MGSDEKILLYLENKFHEIATDVDNITYEDFKNVVKNKEEYFTRKMFSYCDKDNSKTISLQEFTSALERLMKKGEILLLYQRVPQHAVWQHECLGVFNRHKLLKTVNSVAFHAPLYPVQCTVYGVQCTLYSVQCIV